MRTKQALLLLLLTTTGLFSSNNDNHYFFSFAWTPSCHRRDWLFQMASSTLCLSTPQRTMAAQRAVGSGEEACRRRGDCLESLEWDGALGWDWGGKDRCDALDPRCGANGQMRRNAIVAQPIPTADTKKITHVAAIQIEIGREEDGILQIGLYGHDFPQHVAQVVEFLSSDGLVTIDNNNKNSLVGSVTQGVSLLRDGTITSIVPNQLIALGVLSQEKAYFKSRGRVSKVDNFVPQPRPIPLLDRPPIRNHDVAGLLSFNRQGLGYGGSDVFGKADNSAFGSTLLLTAGTAVPFLDQRNLVVGQVIDATSMAFLERLSNVPTQRGIRGVLPGQTSGPPLPKIKVLNVKVATVTGQ